MKRNGGPYRSGSGAISGMPSSPINDPEHWLKRAEEARALAIHMDPVSKEMMLGIAKDYERLAERAAERAKGERP
jgi:hypothetical protein